MQDIGSLISAASLLQEDTKEDFNNCVVGNDTLSLPNVKKDFIYTDFISSLIKK